jgi:hypothetical protein
MTAAPRPNVPQSSASSGEPLLGLLGALGTRRGIPSRPPGIFGLLADLLTSPPPSTGPCYDKPKGVRDKSC